MNTSLVVVGAGGFGREVIDVVEAINAAAVRAGSPQPWTLTGVVDDSPSALNLGRLSARSVPWLGTLENYLANSNPSEGYVVGIGSPSIRRRIAERFDAVGRPAATLIHPAAVVGSMTSVGGGSVLCAGARVTTNVLIGRHVHLNPNVTVGHDTQIEDFVSLNPMAAISGDCVVESGVLVGVGGVVLNGLRVGGGATIGGAACAVRDVASGSTVVGVPARPLTPH